VDFKDARRNLQIAHFLKALRQEQNLTMEELSRLSQVPLVHLASIEEGKFSRFDDFYLKLYLKKYTATLDVDLEQLYTYATQQPLPEVVEAPAEQKRNMTRMQADISSVPKSVAETKPKRSTATIKAANIAQLEAKLKIKRFLVSLVLLALVGVVIFFVITLIRDLPNRETEPPPQAITNPHPITVPTTAPAETEPVTEPVVTEPQVMPEDTTSTSFYDHSGGVQTIMVQTTHDELILRFEHTGQNWFDHANLNGVVHSINATYNDTFELDFELESGENRLFIRMGALHAVSSIYINDVEVEFISSGINGPQSFVFYIEVE